MADDRPTRCVWCAAPLPASPPPASGVTWCGSCGSATTDPWPDAATLDAAYEGWYRPASGRFSGVGDALLRRTRGRLARRIDRVAPPGPVLDVGSGDGALVDALRRAGRRAEGIERTDGDGELEPGWAAVVFWHSLEHLEDPRRALERAADLLMPGGLLVVAIPNAGSLQARAFGAAWFALDLPRHLVHITAPALLHRLAEVGFTVERVSHVRGGQVLFGWLHGIVGALPGDLRLYDAIRRPGARSRPMGGGTRATTLAAGVAGAPVAAVGWAAEVVGRRGGSVYVEARLARAPGGFDPPA